jgi:hypothetical protein
VQLHAAELGTVAYAAINDHAGPAVLDGCLAEIATEERVTTRSTAIDDQDPALPGPSTLP